MAWLYFNVNCLQRRDVKYEEDHIRCGLSDTPQDGSMQPSPDCRAAQDCTARMVFKGTKSFKRFGVENKKKKKRSSLKSEMMLLQGMHMAVERWSLHAPEQILGL